MNYELPLVESLSLGSEKTATNDSIKNALNMVDGIEMFENRFLGSTDKYIGKTINKDGVELSGGEHQKLALARALIQNRSMVILDEPTSNLDPYAETAIIKQFLKYNIHKSTIIVSHRLSAARYVDRIIVMENSRIVEQGSHEELIEKDGKYAYIFNLQAEQYK